MIQKSINQYVFDVRQSFAYMWMRKQQINSMPNVEMIEIRK